MNLPIQNPPADWRVIPSANSIQLRRGHSETDVKSPVIMFGGAGLFFAAFIAGVRIWSGVAPLDALLSWPTLFPLLPAAIMIGVALFAARNAGSDRWFVLEPGKLTVHSRSDSKLSTQTVERNRLLRFIRSRDEDPDDPEGTMWWLDFEARGAGPDPDEIYIGAFTDRQEVEWFTSLFERWSGMRVKDELMTASDKADEGEGEEESDTAP